MTKIPRVAFQGERGAYGEMAAKKFFSGRRCTLVPCADFCDVFESVERGKADYCIVPVENSLEGAVTAVNDLLAETKLSAVGEAVLPIEHSLLAMPGTSLREVSLVYSHPQALAQCRKFIRRHKLEPVPFYNTAGAAKMLAEKKIGGTAVIASDICAEIYGLRILKRNVQDEKGNSTRFLVMARRQGQGPRGDKTSIIFSTRNEAGALARILDVFAERGLNLTRIESRPSRRKLGEYFFLVDFEGNGKERRTAEVLEAARRHTVFLKILGCYKSFNKNAHARRGGGK